MKTLHELATKLQKYIIQSQEDAHNQTNLNVTKYNNLKLRMETRIHYPNVIVCIGISEATFNIADGTKTDGGLGPDEKYVRKWLGSSTVIADLKEEGDRAVVAKGGRGGRGNLCFKSNYNKTPRIAENGMPGETKRIVLELKLLADVGLVGFPSVGKSTFLSVVSKANPLIGDYDFTTIEPNLGVCYINKFENFVIADLPGLIEGAAKGRGLGFTFLRHIERCKVICHMISLDGRYDPIFAYKTIENELKEYGNNLEKKKRIIVCTKLDCDGATERFLKFKEEMLSKNVEQVYAISSLTHQNLDEVCKILYQTVLETNTNEEEVEENNEDHKIYTLKEEKEKFNIIKVKNNLFKIYGETVEKTFKLINISSDEGMLRLLKYLDNLGGFCWAFYKNVSFSQLYFFFFKKYCFSIIIFIL